MRLLICPFGGQIYLLQMSLGHLLVPGSTEVLKIMKKKYERRLAMFKGTGTNLKEFPTAKLKQFEKQNK